MQSLRILICGGDSAALQKVAQMLCDEGVQVQTTTRITDYLCRPNQRWDLLLIDMDTLTSFLRGLLPAVRIQFPELGMLGVSNGTSPHLNSLVRDLHLDGYMTAPPRREDLISRLSSSPPADFEPPIG